MPDKITVWQRAVLMLMCAQYRLHNYVAHGEPIAWELLFTRRALEHAMWFDWQPYHTKAVQKLIELKWIEQRQTSAGLIAYTLTRAAYVALEVSYSDFMDHTEHRRKRESRLTTDFLSKMDTRDEPENDMFAIPRP